MEASLLIVLRVDFLTNSRLVEITTSKMLCKHFLLFPSVTCAFVLNTIHTSSRLACCNTVQELYIFFENPLLSIGQETMIFYLAFTIVFTVVLADVAVISSPNNNMFLL